MFCDLMLPLKLFRDFSFWINNVGMRFQCVYCYECFTYFYWKRNRKVPICILIVWNCMDITRVLKDLLYLKFMHRGCKGGLIAVNDFFQVTLGWCRAKHGRNFNIEEYHIHDFQCNLPIQIKKKYRLLVNSVNALNAWLMLMI